METKRLNKFISESGICSRRTADKFIENGAVKINGKKANLGSVIVEGDEITVNGQVLEQKRQSIIIVYNKPVGVVCTTDPDDPDNVVHAVGHSERIFPIGRLDKDSQGLLLLTNEGDIVNKILREGNQHEKEYLVTVDLIITPDFITKMQNGVPILGVCTRKCKIEQKTPNSFYITLQQGLNRQIRRMCTYLGYEVVRLERIRLMHIKLGNLAQGEYRNLTNDERDLLYKQLTKSQNEAPKPKSKLPEKRDKQKQEVKSESRGSVKKTAAPTRKSNNKTYKAKTKPINPNSKRITRRG